MKYICAQPDELYYAWQVEVMLNNFLSVGIINKDIHVVVGINKNIGEWWYKLIQKYGEVGFYFYEDTRESKKYPPSIQPHILNKHWERFPWLYFENIFYHDCDIVFTKVPIFSYLLKDNCWYFSDTISYIGYDYIISKGTEVYKGMCKVMNIHEDIPKQNRFDSGGAQHIMKKVTSSFWKRVETKSEDMYEYLSSTDSDIQKWTAGMWALLWTGWYWGYKIKINHGLNFSMATDTWPKWNKNCIYHNAGVVQEHKGKLFIKEDFRSILPYGSSNIYDKQFCSHYYFNEIMKTGEKTCLNLKKSNYDDLLNEVKSIFL